jgi:hypothetical protein
MVHITKQRFFRNYKCSTLHEIYEYNSVIRHYFQIIKDTNYEVKFTISLHC